VTRVALVGQPWPGRRHHEDVAAVDLDPQMEHAGDRACRRVPRDPLEPQRDRAGDVVGDHQVDPAGVGDEPERVVDRGALEVEVDRRAAVLPTRPAQLAARWLRARFAARARRQQRDDEQDSEQRPHRSQCTVAM
jgi:hypothetical protein